MPREKKEIIIGIIALVLTLAVLGVAAWLLRQAPPIADIPGLSGGTETTRDPNYPLIPIIPTEPGPTAAPNPYGPEDFLLQDGFMSLVEGETVTGIDVSYYQKDIDWQQVADAGITFVIVRLGCRGYETGNLILDQRVYEYLQGARSAGLQIGAYFYSQAINAEEAAEEARFALEILNGFRLDMPIAYDWEYVSDTARTANMDGRTLMECTIAFCDTIRAGGYETMVYFNPHMSEIYLDLAALQEKGYPFWLAHYTDAMTFPYRVEMWQYSYTGKVPGITGNVDLNIILP